MKVTKYKSNQLVSVSINKYRIDWTKAPSKGQLVLQSFLYPYWKDYIVLAEMRIPGCLKRIDLLNVNKKIIIEFSPQSHHNNYNEFFHKNRANYLKSLMSDIDKMDWAAKNGYVWIEIYDEDLPLLSLDYFKTKFDIDLV